MGPAISGSAGIMPAAAVTNAMAMEEDDAGTVAQQPQNPVEESIEAVIPLLNSPMNKGDYWYLLDKKWFETFKSYIKDMDPSLNPGPIDNSPLFKNADSKDTVLELRERLQEDLDFVFVPEKGWEMLVNEFSIVSENHVIRRAVIEQGHFSAYTIVEVYPIELKLCIYGSKADIITKSFSRVTPFRELVSEIKRIHAVDADREVQIWSNGSILNQHSEFSSNMTAASSSSSSSATYSPSNSTMTASGSVIPLPPPFPPSTVTTAAAGPSSSPTPSSSKSSDNVSLTDLGLHTGSVVTMELKNADGTWPSSRPKYGSVATRSSKCTPGLCGLMNLGNTCFMNSALQCMSNTTYLTDFFLSDTHLKEINASNPLGMGGQIARTYGDLIKSMWSGAHSCQAPREFKLAVGRFAPQFSGFQQQDCQELMAFLLDGLHEDLNRITQKPYIEISTEIDKRPDKVVAAESWSNYKKRNDSIIVDTFHGLLKSTLVCPDCELVSVTFDPFCYLSLPLPVKRERAIDLTFVPAALTTSSETSDAGNEEVQMIKLSKFMIPKVGVISEICNVAARAVNDNCRDQGYTVDPDRLIVAEVCNHRFQKLFSNDDDYSMQLDSVCVFETLEDKIPVPVYLREDKGNEQTSLFGMPTIVNIDELTYDQLYSAVISYVKRMFKMEEVQHDDPMNSQGEAAAAAAAPVEEEDMDADEGIAGLEDEIFTLTLVNSYGSLSHEKLERGKPIKATSKMYVAADFSPKWRKRYCEDREQSLCHRIAATKSLSSRTAINLSDCMNQFTTTEKLGSEDPWFCPRCKKHQEATKKFDLWDLPKVLIIHLKRFSYSRFWRDKLDALVSFPIHGLDMSPYVINAKDSAPKDKKLYDLVAVANHYGGLGGGHYTAYGKNRETRQWHYFDDANVSNASEENVVSKGAYVLFYQRRE